MEVYFRNFIYFINLYLRRANCNSSINSFHQGLFQNIAILQRYFEKKVYDVQCTFVLIKLHACSTQPRNFTKNGPHMRSFSRSIENSYVFTI